MLRKIDTVRLQDDVSEEFTHSDDVTRVLDDFSRDLISDEEMKKRLVELKQLTRESVERRYLGPSEPDDTLARPGTWDREAGFPVIRRRSIGAREQAVQLAQIYRDAGIQVAESAIEKRLGAGESEAV